MTKLFINNLSFQTGAETLGKLFETVGIVKAAKISTSKGISLGYGTVEMETEEAAQQAIEKLNGQELEGRNIRVEYEGRERVSHDRGGFRGRGSRGFERRGGGFRGRRASNFTPREGLGFRGRWDGGYVNNIGYSGGYGSNIGYGGGYGFSRYGSFGNGFRGRPRGGFRPLRGFGGAPFRSGYGRGGFRGRGFRGRGFRSGTPRRGGQSRGGRVRTPFDPNTPLSKTRVYINNLPFNLTDEGLQKIFTEKGLHIKEVSLGKRRFNTERNLGFGFVEFETEEEQAKVLRDFANIDINNRPCTIFAARPPPKENQENINRGNA